MAQKKRKRKHVLRRIILTLLFLVILAGVGYYGYTQLKAEYTTVYDSYTTSTGSISNSLSFSGTLSAVNSAQYSSTSEATVRQVYVAVGDDVKEGDKLIRLSNGETLTAGFDGRVNQLTVEKGDTVRAGETIVEICDFDHMKTSFRVDEYDIGDVHVGDAVRITVTATDQVFDSVIDSINYISASQGNVAYYTTTVKVDTTGADGVYPGMQVTITIPQEEATDVVILKVDALSFDERNQAYVYLMDETEAMVQQYVTVGVSNGNYAEIKEGLTADQTVYVESEEQVTTTGLASLFSSMMSSQQVNTNSRGNRGGGNSDFSGDFSGFSGTMPSGNFGGGSGSMPSGNFGGGTP